MVSAPPVPPAAPPPRASVAGIVANVLLGVAELGGLGAWILVTLAVGALSTSSARPTPDAEVLAWVGLPGLVPFGLATVFCVLGAVASVRGRAFAGFAWAAAAFVLGLIPWGVVCWVFWRAGKF